MRERFVLVLLSALAGEAPAGRRPVSVASSARPFVVPMLAVTVPLTFVLRFDAVACVTVTLPELTVTGCAVPLKVTMSGRTACDHTGSDRNSARTAAST